MSERKNSSMNNESNTNSIILVVEDVSETRDGIEKLLKADGYRVTLARDEKDAIESAQREPPNLILVSVAGLPHEVVIAARHIRELAALGENVPVVVFCIAEIDEGDEIAIGKKRVYHPPRQFQSVENTARSPNELHSDRRVNKT
jgi:CheY-like chemotaxis protein